MPQICAICKTEICQDSLSDEYGFYYHGKCYRKPSRNYNIYNSGTMGITFNFGDDFLKMNLAQDNRLNDGQLVQKGQISQPNSRAIEDTQRMNLADNNRIANGQMLQSNKPTIEDTQRYGNNY